MTTIAFITLLCLIQSIFCKLSIDHQIVKSFSSPEDFMIANPQIEVFSSSNKLQAEDYETLYYKMVETGRNKRHSYDYFIRKSKKFVERLVDNMIVPNGRAVIQSAIQMNFINKKRAWEFCKLYEFQVLHDDIQILQSLVSGFKLIKLKDQIFEIKRRPIKHKIIQAFNAAKLQLNYFLLNYFQGDLTIKKLKQFEVNDLLYFSSVDAEEDSHEKSPTSQSSSKGYKQRNFQQQNIEKDQLKTINVKAVFEIGADRNKQQQMKRRQLQILNAQKIQKQNLEEQSEENANGNEQEM